MSQLKNAISIIIIFLFIIAGIKASISIAEFLGNDSKPSPLSTTRFYVTDETDADSGKLSFYRMIIENREGSKMEYDLNIRLAQDIIYSQKIALDSNDRYSKMFSFDNSQIQNYQKLEFLLYRDKDLYRSRVFQIKGVTDPNLLSDTGKVITPESIERGYDENYTVQHKDEIITYTFNTGEKLELKVSNELVKKEDALYTTVSKGNNIIFLGEPYEKVLPYTVQYINPIILNMADIKLKVNDTIKLKNSYTVTLDYIEDNKVKFIIREANRPINELIGTEEFPAEYWQKLDEYKKQKILSIIPKKIYKDEVVLDLIQYNGDEVVMVGNMYGEFQVTNITEDSITLKNIQDIAVESGQEIYLINSKIKIKI